MRLIEFAQASADLPVPEAFNNPSDLTWVKQTSEWWKAEFESGNITYWVNLYAQKWDDRPCWVVDFGVGHKDAEAHGLKTTAPTGLRKPHSVISSVKSAFDQFMTMHRPRPQMLVFYDSDGVASRTSMYDRFAKYVCSAFGYQPDEAESASAKRRHGKHVWILQKI